MTCFVAIETKCPECGTSIKEEIYGSINVNINPELKDKLLRNEINKVICPNCGYSFCVLLSLLYNDLDNRLWIHCFPPEEISIWPEHELDTIGSDKEFRSRHGHLISEEKFHVSRVVFGLDFLIEKINIFDNGLDDIAIEIHKIHLMSEEQRDDPPRIYFESLDRENKTITYIMISGKDESEYVVPGNLYLDIVEKNKKSGINARGNAFVDYRRFIGPFAEDQKPIEDQFLKYRHMQKKKKRRDAEG